MVLVNLRLRNYLRPLCVGAIIFAGYMTTVGKTTVPDDPLCAVNVTTGFAGDQTWTAIDGMVGLGADGNGGVAIGAGLSLGPIKGALVTVRHADGTALGSAATGPDGRVTFKSCGHPGPYQVDAAGQPGATYFDESAGLAGAEVPFGEGELLRAYVPSIERNIGVTPFTEAAVQMAQSGNTAPAKSVTAGGMVTAEKALPDSASIVDANRRIRALISALVPAKFAIDDIVGLAAAGGPNLPPLQDNAAGRHALVLGAFGRQAALFNPSLSAPALDAARQFARDAADGFIDGIDAAGAPVATAGARVYDAARLVLELESATAVVTRRYADPGLMDKLPIAIALGAAGLPDSQGVAIPTAVRMRSAGTIHTLNLAGADVQQMATDAFVLFSASQQPPTAMFIKRSDGAVLAVGHNSPAGLLGNGAVIGTATPVTLGALQGASAISIGKEHVLARMADGTVLGWGNGSSGQLASGPSTLIPKPVLGVRDVLSVTAVSNLSLALSNDGTIASWGMGAGALGTGSVSQSTKAMPSQVLVAAGQPLDRVVAMAAYLGTEGTPDPTVAAVRSDGTVWAWGDNASGGLGEPGSPQGFARQVPGLTKVSRLAATANGFIALDADGAVFVWGRTTPTAGGTSIQLTPTRVDGLPQVRNVVGGFPGVYQTRLVDADGQRWRIDGLGAAQVTEQSELDVKPPTPGITSIAVISDDDRVNAAERNAGVVVSGTVSQPNRPVRVVAGNATRDTTAVGTAWSVTLTPGDLPSSGTVNVMASFTTIEGAPSGVASRAIVIDTTPPTVTISDNVSGNATGPITFTFTWSEPVTGFESSDVAASGGARGAFSVVSPGVYTLVVTPGTSNGTATATVSVPVAVASDLAGNANASATSGSQVLGDSVSPTVAILTHAVEVELPRPGVQVTFRFTWNKGVQGSFSSEDIELTYADGSTVPGSNRGSLAPLQNGNTAYLLKVDLPFDRLTATATVRKGTVTDTSNNINQADVSATSRSNGVFDGDLGGDGSSGPGSASGGATGNGGVPGSPPAPFLVQPVRSGDRLELKWKNHNAIELNVPAVVFYQVLVRYPSVADQGDVPSNFDDQKLERVGRPIPAVYEEYRVSIRTPSLTGPNFPPYYRIRACNTRPDTPFPPDDAEKPDALRFHVEGTTGCRDSNEFNSNGGLTKFCPSIQASNFPFPLFVNEVPYPDSCPS